MARVATTNSSSGVPTTQTAIRQVEGGELEIFHDAALPYIPNDQMLVKVVAVALNPADFKMPHRFPSPRATCGSDFAGLVVAVGPKIAKSFKIGDRVFGAVYGANPIDHEAGSFAQYLRADPEFTFNMPESMSYETAASIGASVLATLALALFRALRIPFTPEQPTENPKQVLVWGGSTACGTMAIQLLRLCGHIPITTCSPKNFDLVKSYGAEAIFDYNSPTCAADIKAYTKNTLSLVLDPLTEAATMKACYECIGRAGGRYVCLEMYKEHQHTRKAVKIEFIMGSAILGGEVALDQGYGSAADPEKRRFGIEFYRQVQRLFDEGQIKPHPIRIVPGGFQGILDGLEDLKHRRVSAQKLVIVLDPEVILA
ncbi:MAG: putative secondary metabolism biosynthetic enzyme [Geoglossum umbratile]|nr:MAG: putative secondary metabolism biosynthetic enzyme [Geoglossum umbratile]